jgi:hypothetical protein
MASQDEWDEWQRQLNELLEFSRPTGQTIWQRCRWDIIVFWLAYFVFLAAVITGVVLLIF